MKAPFLLRFRIVEESAVNARRFMRLHWGLPDPAAGTASAQEILAAFRKIRDELLRRITAFLKESC